MVRLECSRSGWGAVRDPETDEYVALDSDVSEDVADRLTERYPEVERADDADADDGELEDEDEDKDEDKDESEPDYSDLEYSELRRLASESDIDGIDGRSSRQEIIAALENDNSDDNEED